MNSALQDSLYWASLEGESWITSGLPTTRKLARPLNTRAFTVTYRHITSGLPVIRSQFSRFARLLKPISVWGFTPLQVSALACGQDQPNRYWAGKMVQTILRARDYLEFLPGR